MLSTLRIQNLAIIHSLEVDFLPGLNVLTGETGSGKSIILKSLELLCGKRTSTDILRSGADKAVIEGLFHLSDFALEHLKTIYDGIDEIVTSGELIVRRTIDKHGRSKFQLNEAMMPLSSVSQIMGQLIEITGQHDVYNLKKADYHRALLDSFENNNDLLEQVATLYSQWKKECDHLTAITTSRSSFLERFEALTSIKSTLSEARLQEGEKELLLQELNILKHADNIRTSLIHACNFLDSSLIEEQREDQGKDAYQTMSSALDHLELAAEIDPTLNNLVELGQQAFSIIRELASQVNDSLHKQSLDPIRLEEIQNRITLISQLERRYGKPADDLPNYLEEVDKTLSSFDSTFLDEEKIRKKVALIELELAKKEKALSILRHESALKLEKTVNISLKEIGLPKATFTVSVYKGDRSATGIDNVSFLFSANPGEPLNALEKIASGGELSRLQLILKTLAGDNKQVALHVFDEIDTGVGGAIAQLVGEKLFSLAQQSQAIVITHSAQVAALADSHILVSKKVIGERTFCKAEVLDSDKRLESVAAMLAGRKVTKDFIQSAMQLITHKKEMN